MRLLYILHLIIRRSPMIFTVYKSVGNLNKIEIANIKVSHMKECYYKQLFNRRKKFNVVKLRKKLSH